MFKGIVFDLDGTLIHSKVDFIKMKKKMIELLLENGTPEGTLSPLMTTVEIMRITETHWEKKGIRNQERTELRGKIEATMNEVELEALETVLEVPGAKKVIEKLFMEGYKLAILTRGHHEYAEKALEKTGMLSYFEIIFGRGETPKPKPYPEALLYTAQTLSLGRGEILFIGDHHIDLTCAMNAKVPFLGVQTGQRGEESWEDIKPTILLESIKEIPAFLKNNRDRNKADFYY
jgi:phosphoglycolate phosphatase